MALIDNNPDPEQRRINALEIEICAQQMRIRELEECCDKLKKHLKEMVYEVGDTCGRELPDSAKDATAYLESLE